MQSSAQRPMPPVDKDNFWEWLSSLAPADWENMMCYLYRTQPTIDRRQNGRPTNIRKYTQPFDQERVMIDEGSGGYRLDVCWRDPVSGKSNRIGQHYFPILNMDYPPRVPAGDWLDDPDNEAWKWAAPHLQQVAAQRHAEMVNPGQNPSELLETVVNVMDKLRPHDAGKDSVSAELARGMNGLHQTMLQMADPTKQLEGLKTIVGMLRPPELPKTDDPMVKFLLEEIRELRKVSRVEAKPFLEQMVEAMPIIERVMGQFGFKRGGVTREAGTNWGELVIGVLDKVGEHVPMIVDAIRAGNGAEPRPNAGFNLANTRPQREAAPTPAAAAPAQPPAQEGESNLTEDEKQKYQAILDKYGKMLQGVAMFLIDQFKADMTGYDFRDWFINRQGLILWTSLRDEVGTENLVGLIQQHPQLKAQLAPKEKLTLFLTEFFTAEGEEPAGSVVDNPSGA